MKQARRGMFETNSSSTHSITMCMKEDYNKWINGKVLLNDGVYSSDSEFAGKQFVTLDEARDILRHYKYAKPGDPDPDTATVDEIVEYFDGSICTHGSYRQYNEYLDDFEEEFTTPGGEEIVAFGVYGYDG